MQDPTDNLSAVARAILKRDAERAYTALVVTGDGNPSARADLDAADPRKLCAGLVRDMDQARAMLAGLWLWHDYLDQSHRISQSLENPTGSFWHAIMHRREGDFANSKYWYRRAGDHPALMTIGANANAILNPLPADNRLLRINMGGALSGPALVELVQEVYQRPVEDPLHGVAIALQQLEWRILFDHCARAAQV